MHLVRVFLAIATAACFADESRATGYFGPNVYLDQGGKRVDGSPEFYWELEVKRLAREFHPTEKFLVRKQQENEDEDRRASGIHHTTTADIQDFNEALKSGAITPPDAGKARQQHKAAREAIDRMDSGNSLPEEFDSEFADYHRGAFAYRRGSEHWQEASNAWQELLNRPEHERKYRSVWAAFMLGKIALKSNEYATAVTWFQRTRERAKAGFVDSLGVAADSYGWEGRAEWKQQHSATAARLFLTQLTLGDESAIVSLKALIPDRQPVEGMLNYGPEPDDVERRNAQEKQKHETIELDRLREAARDPLLRRLVTCHILAAASAPNYYDETHSPARNRCARWLAIVNEQKIKSVEDAEYLGWAAYNVGNYDAAEEWLRLTKEETPAANWLRAKLQRRAGKLTEAAQSMAKAWEVLRDERAYTGWHRPDEITSSFDEISDAYIHDGHWTFEQSASGDLGGLRLARADFLQALHVLVQGGMWEDAAYVAERVLTANELKSYVDKHSESNSSANVLNDLAKLRYLLGRRLVREHRYAEAGNYLPIPYDKILERFMAMQKRASDRAGTKVDRARAFFSTAWIARYDGMEIMGTEGAPDGFAEGGDFELPDIAEERLSGVYEQVQFDKNFNPIPAKANPVVLKTSPQERLRLERNKIEPNKRFHYRLIAGALAIKAAALLPNNSEELADVVNRAGLWVKEHDPKTADRCYNIIERRCPNTEIGRAVIERHWFVDRSGPWSTAQAEARRALQKELNINTSGNE